MAHDAGTATPGTGQDGETAPPGRESGLVRLRRKSDWTRTPRPADDAAEAAYRAALDLATATLAAYDGGTASHSDDVITLCLALAEQLCLEGRERTYLLAAAELHDIGKVGIPSDILRKPGPLDEGEWEAMRQHTVTGQRILGAVPELVEVARIVRHCHERWDGGGYPDGLTGDDIPLAARIVFCADAFHAIRGDRPYRRGRSALDALAEIEAHSGTQFDPDVVAALGRVAERMRRRRPFKAAMLGGERRSQRLAALLLTLAVGGSALAATGVWSPGGDGADSTARATVPPPAATAAALGEGSGLTVSAGGAGALGRAGEPGRRDRTRASELRVRRSGPEAFGRAERGQRGAPSDLQGAPGSKPAAGLPGGPGAAPPSGPQPARPAPDSGGAPESPAIELPQLPAVPVPVPELPAVSVPELPAVSVPKLSEVSVPAATGLRGVGGEARTRVAPGVPAAPTPPAATPRAGSGPVRRCHRGRVQRKRRSWAAAPRADRASPAYAPAAETSARRPCSRPDAARSRSGSASRSPSSPK